MIDMVAYEDECVGCPPELGCFGSACPKSKVKHLYCDKCKDDTDKLYRFNGYELCEECLKKEFEVIE